MSFKALSIINLQSESRLDFETINNILSHKVWTTPDELQLSTFGAVPRLDDSDIFVEHYGKFLGFTAALSKRVSPPSLVKAMLEEKIYEKKLAGHVVSATEKRSMKAAIEIETALTMPAGKSYAEVFIDVDKHQMIVTANTTGDLDIVRKEINRIFYDNDIHCSYHIFNIEQAHLLNWLNQRSLPDSIVVIDNVIFNINKKKQRAIIELMTTEQINYYTDL